MSFLNIQANNNYVKYSLLSEPDISLTPSSLNKFTYMSIIKYIYLTRQGLVAILLPEYQVHFPVKASNHFYQD